MMALEGKGTPDMETNRPAQNYGDTEGERDIIDRPMCDLK
jgi:hypothetical protein